VDGDRYDPHCFVLIIFSSLGSAECGPEHYWNQVVTRKLKTAAIGDDGKAEMLEFRWDGCQSIVLGYHPMTKTYRYLPGQSFALKEKTRKFRIDGHLAVLEHKKLSTGERPIGCVGRLGSPRACHH
jgi:hypothetical protein